MLVRKRLGCAKQWPESWREQCWCNQHCKGALLQCKAVLHPENGSDEDSGGMCTSCAGLELSFQPLGVVLGRAAPRLCGPQQLRQLAAAQLGHGQLLQAVGGVFCAALIGCGDA